MADRPTTEPRTVMDALKELTEAAGVMLAAEDYQAANERRLLRAAVAAQAFIEAEAAQGAASPVALDAQERGKNMVRAAEKGILQRREADLAYVGAASPAALDVTRAIEEISGELSHYDLSDDPGYIKVPTERVRAILRARMRAE